MSSPRHTPTSSLASTSRGKVATTNSAEPADRASLSSKHPPISHVFLAEFDIDQGSILKHQYPGQTSIDEHLLAEHMLPDGAHDRQEDWTVFYLNQIPPLTISDPSTASTSESDATSVTSGAAGAEVNGQKSELLYVMSLVRTKKDATVRRGALVKALAVASHHPYIQVFKPVLLLALEAYFIEPSSAYLVRLFHSINSMDMSDVPNLSFDERLVLRATERKDFFEEKWSRNSAAKRHHHSANSSTDRSSIHDHQRDSKAPYHHQHGSIVHSPSTGSLVSAEVLDGSDPPQSISSSSISSLASGTRTHPTSSAEHSFSSSIPSAEGSHYARSRDNTLASSEGDFKAPFLRGLGYLNGGGASSTAINYSYSTQGDGSRSVTPSASASLAVAKVSRDTHWFDSKITFNSLTIPIRIPVSTFPEEIGDYSLIKLIQAFSSPTSLAPGPLHPHLHTSGSATPPIIVLFNALITNKRVVFLGHGHAANLVANLVLAACALASGCGAVLGGFVERAFPYTNLTNLDNLENVPGFIAGVCNPAFADRPSWWDVLCNYETGKIIVSKEIIPATPMRTHTVGRTATASLLGMAISPDIAGTYGDDGESVGGGRTPSLASASLGSGVSAASGAAAGSASVGRVQSYDHEFMDEILTSIASHHGEAAIRARFTDYVQRFVRVASRYEEDVMGSTSIGYPCSPFIPGPVPVLGSGVFFPDETMTTREMSINAGRVEGWSSTDGYILFKQSFALDCERPMRQIDLSHQLARLRYSRRMPSTEVAAIMRNLFEFCRNSEDAVIALLARLPAHMGGLLPLAFGLFHPSTTVRSYTLSLFDQINANPTGRKFILSLNAFHRSAYHRLCKEKEVDRVATKLNDTLEVGSSPAATSQSQLDGRRGSQMQ
ncbi:BQ2448_5450 [Microbotryum intermedium]|uniref:BQ2448_5450 protein n=1 Tax=Microbotryum intermedium TaxID=269621 RepID=A0A238F547_9BASI|nr:BQ2448_5450 [Microbotryum intermedium]